MANTTEPAEVDPVAALALVDSCTVSDAMDALELSGWMPGLNPLWEGARLIGRAVTVRLVEGTPPSGARAPHLGARAIASARPGDVIVIDNGGRMSMGSWGGLLSLAAQMRRVAGVVADGAVRDIDEARELGFPVFGRGGVPQTARGRVYEESFGEPVTLAGVRVAPGDLVMADGSGVVVIAADDVARVAAKAMTIHERELQMQQELRAGQPVTNVLGRSYEQMLTDGGSAPGHE